ncbi:MAG TPA: Ig-like domain-containing protein [Bradyrhizobium sp.]|nr:Ig-like domain-containing protein [Bradyrhizobium sp.]
MALGPGSIAFVGINTNGQDWFAIAAIDPIPAGTVIYFTDNELPNSNSTSFNTGESYTKWTATSDVAAGTVINFSVFYGGGALNGGIAVSTGTATNIAFPASANPGLSTTQDSLYAYLAASDATVDTPTAFLSFINLGTSADPVPAALATGQYISFVNAADSAYYTGPHDNQLTFAGFLAEINNPANWTLAGTTDNSTLNASHFVLDVPPALVSSAPSDNATGVSPASDIVLTFSETVQKGTGSILIKNALDNSVVQTIDVASAAVTVSGNTVTINPPADLAPNHSYYIEIATGAIKDTTNNNFAGISGATSLNFTTAASETQKVAFDVGSLTVSHNEGQTGATDYVFAVTRSGGTTGDVSFSGTFASAATDNADYAGGKPVSFSGTILAGQESGTVTIHVAGDKTVENDESFTLTLGAASNDDAGIALALGANLSATGTILNDDGFIVHSGQTLTKPQTLGDGNTGTVESGGVFAVTGSSPAVTWTGGTVVISNAGIFSANARAIDSAGSVLADGSSLTIENALGGTISSATSDVVRVNHDLTNGTILIDNFGTMSTQAGQGIDLNNVVSASTHSTINNFGLISAAADDGIRPGTNATINNHSQIVGMQGGDGIDGQQGINIVIHNFAGGSITGARHGVTGDFPITVTNDAGATILGQQGSGLNMDTAPDSTMIVVNHGTITGTATGTNDGDGVDVDGLIALDNYGLIRAVGHSADVINEALAIGGGIVNNYSGGVIHSDERAITVDDSDLGNAFGATTIYNEGTIQGDNGQAIAITDSFADTITNKGAIIGSVATGGGDDLFNLYTGSFINGAIDGGSGHDTFNLLGNGAGVVTSFSHVEAIDLFAGDWTLGSEGVDSVTFAGSGTLRLASSLLADGHFDGTIDSFSNVDSIDLEGIGTANQATLGANNVLKVSGGSGGPVSLQLDPGQDFTGFVFQVASDGAGGTNLSMAKVINGGNGNSALTGTAGNDVISGGNGNDTVDSGDGNDTISGGNGNDILRSGNGRSTLDGGNGDDILSAGNGNNTLLGGNGNDVFHVGSGNNSLTGGNGSDTFVFGPGFGKDVITDFSHGDHIEFDGVFKSFQDVHLQQVGANTAIYLDAGADADHSITLLDVAANSLHASDFLLH